jgi:hypothetical protein
LIVLTLILLGIGRIGKAFTSEKMIFWSVGALVAYVAMLSGLQANPLAALKAPLELAGYMFLAAAISRTRWNRSQLSTLWILTAGGLLVSSALTIVDFAGIMNVPYANQATTETSAAGLTVQQASGFFTRRSGMAGIFALSIAGSLALALAHESSRTRLYYLAAACSGLLCLFLTHNRSGVLGSIAVAAIYTLVSPRFGGVRRIGILTGAAILSGTFLAVVILFYPEAASVYHAKLGFIGMADTTWSSDHYRVELFLAAIRSLGENPLGNGFTSIPLPGGLLMDPHNTVTVIIWAMGIFSFIWLPVFAAAVYFALGRRFTNRSDRMLLSVESDALSCALFAWLLNSMAHSAINTGLAWIMFGLMLSIRYFSDPQQETGRTALGSAASGT